MRFTSRTLVLAFLLTQLGFLTLSAQTRPGTSSNTVDRSVRSGPSGLRAGQAEIAIRQRQAAFEEIQSWDKNFGGPGPNGTVYAVAASGTDVYVGGDFSEIGNVRANRIARWDGRQWHPLGTEFDNGVDQSVYAILIDGDNVYVGGQFIQAGAIEASNVAVWNRSSNTWATLGAGVKGAATQPASVSALAKRGNDIYVAGRFTKAGGTDVVNIAKWDGGSWSALGAGVNGVISSMVVSGNDLYVGGTFTSAGGSAAKSIARWSAQNNQWSALGGGVEGNVRSLLAQGSDVYVGGVFTDASGSGAKHIAKWSTSTSSWAKLSNQIDNGTIESGVFALAIDDNYLYVGGDFRMGQKTTWDRIDSVRNVARWSLSGSKWEAMGESLIEYDNQSPIVNAFALAGRKLYVGGKFPMAGFYEATNVAMADLDSRTWTALTTGINGGTGGYIIEGKKQARDTMGVRVLLANGSNLYVGGIFNTAGGAPANSVALWNGQQWKALGSGITDTKLSFPSPPMVSALGMVGNDLYVGGRFNMAGGQAARNIAKWDGSAWTVLPAPASTIAFFDTVFAISSIGTDVYVGGVTRQTGLPKGIVLRWNGTSWDTLGLTFDRQVRAMAVHNGKLYIGGDFSSMGQTTVRALAVYDPAAKTVNPVSDGPKGNVRALVVSGDDMYIAGDFTQVGTMDANRIVKWSPGSGVWTPLGQGLNKSVRSIAMTPAGLFAGGDFDGGDGTGGNFVARWDGTAWGPLGDGTDSRVFAVAGAGDDLYIGGHFWMAGGVQSHYLAHWNRVLLSVDRQDGESMTLATLSAWPNPMATATSLTLSVKQRSHVSLEISSSRGEVVATLVDGTLDLGEHRFTWAPQGMAEGVYFCTLRIDGQVATQKLVVVK